MLVQWPMGVVLRRKEVIGMGVVSAWAFRMAQAEKRLRGTLVARRYRKYMRDDVARAFGWRPCMADGSAARNAIEATHVEVI